MKSIFGISILNSRIVALLCLQAAALSGSLAWAQSPAPGDAAQTTQSPPTYSVTDLGTYSGAIQMGINDKGQVVFSLQTPDSRLHPFLWQDGEITDLGTLGGNDARALGINNKGQVVGFSDTGHHGFSHAFLWQNGRMVDLGTLQGGTASAAYAINDKGQVVGYSDSGQTQTGFTHPFLWQNGQMIDLGTLGGINGDDTATAINNQGQVVGWSLTPKRQDAFLWENGHMTDIAGGAGLSMWPMGINRQGQVTGYTTTVNDDAHVFLWQNGKRLNLGPGVAFGINDKGQVVGGQDVGGRGVGLWQDGKAFDLNALIPSASGWNLGIALAINNLGQIAGSGFHNGEGRYFLLTPQVDATLQTSHPSWRFAAHPIGQTSGPGTIWIHNSGPQPVHFSGIQFSGANAQDFAVTENTCGSILAALTVCKLVFHFTPTAAGQRTASLTLNDNARDGLHSIPVQGFGSSK